ncbi:MAG: acetyl-CoA carboxylase, carboxyltransferase subunit beta [Chitinophagales bacterium]|nr:acetyl-CoA carboxylase, carboxyltransferase subunit beta [Chitinophagales bacterium]
MSNWFKRISQGIRTPAKDKKEMPEGLWFQCPKCKATIPQTQHKENISVCSSCGYHDRISPKEYFDLFFDENSRPKLLFENLYPVDSLEFVDLKSYKQRIEEAETKSGVTEAMDVAVGKMGGSKVVVAAMNFAYIGGSMGAVVGEKIARSVDYCIENKCPLIIISKSGGARMMESGLSLMQMIKTAAKLTQLAEAKLPYISLMTDPTTGGVTASFSMLGDLNIAEPGALIGFAGPRVIMETIKAKELPEGFQSSEYLLEHGFLDFIAERKELKEKMVKALGLLKG